MTDCRSHRSLDSFIGSPGRNELPHEGHLDEDASMTFLQKGHRKGGISLVGSLPHLPQPMHAYPHISAPLSISVERLLVWHPKNLARL